ncbi:MAG: ABC transporter substrate-binding protein [Shimia sp.]|nr:ABC transporter substrate-binding protein [Shimia sp.]
MKRWSVVAATAAVWMAASVAAENAPSRIVSVGGELTEVVFALGEEHRLVARDTTSNFPASALELPDVGYVRRLSAEGVLSVNPDLILAVEGAGPPETMDLLKEAAIDVIEIENGFTRASVNEKIRAVAAVLGVPEKGDVLAARVDAEIATALASVDPANLPRVLFVLSAAGGRVTVGGRETSVDAIISMAGGQNAAGFDGWKQITEEAIITSGADVILMMDRSGDHALSNADVLAHPALGQTPAGQNGAVVRLDGMLLTGFSVRTGEAIAALAKSLSEVTE